MGCYLACSLTDLETGVGSRNETTGCSFDGATTDGGDDGCDGVLHCCACVSSHTHCSSEMSGCYSFALGLGSGCSEQMDCTGPHYLKFDCHRSWTTAVDCFVGEYHRMID